LVKNRDETSFAGFQFKEGIETIFGDEYNTLGEKER
jgi:hypothetical protein